MWSYLKGSHTPTARAPLDRTPSVHKPSANLDRGIPMEGEKPSRRGGVKSRISRFLACWVVIQAFLKGLETDWGKLKMKRERTEPNFLQMMEQMTQLMGKLTQAVAPRDNSKAPAFKNPSMKAPDSSDGTQAH
ncbi:hypothetical protein O181_035108 [Austropuccinia psidii MF-1]|uniref:Uncharacterized protein n=1 Tax=Austropuccinia psidii MF-1 TaxID=1389203 RepID=A0A9Q3D4U0_9BASI|nr:hypothetical protein [Austropuccinia psidii MF-1]